MAADPFSPRVQEPDEPSRLRALGIAAFLMLATAFLYQAMDGVERASELAERRQRIAQSACNSCAPGDDDVQYDDQLAATANADAPATIAAQTAAEDLPALPATPVTSPTPVLIPTVTRTVTPTITRTVTPATAPAEPPNLAPIVPILIPTGNP